MQKIGLHDAEKDHMRHKTFPNYALMKISAYHKAAGDAVEWWEPLLTDGYDKIYSSKVFDFTPPNPFLPDWAIRGGTGYADIPIKRFQRKSTTHIRTTAYTMSAIMQSDT